MIDVLEMSDHGFYYTVLNGNELHCSAAMYTVLYCTAAMYTVLYCCHVYLPEKMDHSLYWMVEAGSEQTFLYTVQCTSYTRRYTVHCTLHTIHCTLYTLRCTLYTLHCTLYTVYCILYTDTRLVRQTHSDNTVDAQPAIFTCNKTLSATKIVLSGKTFITLFFFFFFTI